MTEEGFTVVGTDIEEVKKANQNSGLTYNQAKELLARIKGTKDAGSFTPAEINAAVKQNSSNSISR